MGVVTFIYKPTSSFRLLGCFYLFIYFIYKEKQKHGEGQCSENISAEGIYVAVLQSPNNENLNPKAQCSEHNSSSPQRPPPPKKNNQKPD